MPILNTFFKIAIILAIVAFLINSFTGGFLFSQLDKVDTSGVSNPVICAAGLWIDTPLVDTPLGRLPLVLGSDDVVIMAVFGFALLGLLQYIMPSSRTWPWYKKALPFLFVLFIYRLIGWIMIFSVPGCYELAEGFSDATSPLIPIFYIISAYVLIKTIQNRRK